MIDQDAMETLKKNTPKNLPILWIVIPCYNEQEVLPITAPMFLEKIEQLEGEGLIHKESRILFVNDGSKDRTWEIIRSLSEEDPRYVGIAQSRNRGHQNAVLAGLMEAKEYCDITISIDCDGQDDINAMDEMVRQYLDGCEIVYGVRSRRDTDTWFKRVTAEGFYKMMNKMGAEVVYNHADYRLVSARALRAFENYHEVNLFLRGMFPLVGFKSTSVYYERHESGTEPLPALQDAGTCPGRDHQYEHKAHPSDHRIRMHRSRHQLYRCNLVDRLPFPGIHRHRMVQHGLYTLFSGRHPASGHRHHRRIRRQDLHGDQEAPQIYHQREDLGGSGRNRYPDRLSSFNSGFPNC